MSWSGATCNTTPSRTLTHSGVKARASGPPEPIDEDWWKERDPDLAKQRRARAKKSKRA